MSSDPASLAKAGHVPGKRKPRGLAGAAGAAGTPERSAKPKAVRRPVTSDCQIINALARGLKVLSAFDPGEDLLTNKDLSVRTGLAKPTISRLTSTLVRLHFLDQDPDGGGYRLGTAAVSLGLSAAAAVDIPQIAQSRMRAFAEEHDALVMIGIRDGLDVRALSYARGESDAGPKTMLAARVPLAMSGVGYGLLAGMAPDELERTCEELAAREGDQWPNMKKRIQFAIEDFGLHGYCASIREWRQTRNSIGAPLPRGRSGSELALACSGPATVLTASRIRNVIGPAFRNMIAEITAQSGEDA